MMIETVKCQLERFLLCNGLIVVLEIWRDLPNNLINNCFGTFTKQHPVCFVLPISSR